MYISTAAQEKVGVPMGGGGYLHRVSVGSTRKRTTRLLKGTVNSQIVRNQGMGTKRGTYHGAFALDDRISGENHEVS